MPTSPLVSAADLAARLGTEPPVLLDVRWRLGGPPGAEVFRDGHLPGARYVDLDTELAAPAGAGGRHPLPEAGAFDAAMRRHGVSAGRPVVVYDGADSSSAARAWWLLRYFGHSDVRVLDGGFAAWSAAGLPVEKGDGASPEPGDFSAVAGGLPTLDADAAAALADRGILLDARAAARFRGEVEPVDPVAGHIPGAVSAPTAENVDEAGRFLDAEALRSHFASFGVSDDVEVGTYCGSGVTAAHELLALEVAGFTAVLYPGSWSEWITDPSRPVATGE